MFDSNPMTGLCLSQAMRMQPAEQHAPAEQPATAPARKRHDFATTRARVRRAMQIVAKWQCLKGGDCGDCGAIASPAR